jgi:hypothetical protein
VADTKRMIGKNGEERHKGSLTLTMEKSSWKIWANSTIFKYLPKVNNRPKCENSPTLVTLIRTMTVCRCWAVRWIIIGRRQIDLFWPHQWKTRIFFLRFWSLAASELNFLFLNELLISFVIENECQTVFNG